MKPLTITLYIFFGCMVFLDCFLILHKQEQYRIYTKPLFAPILLAALYAETNKTKHKRSKVFLSLALFFCFIGDYLLLNQIHSAGFVFGLLSFFVAQLFYCIFFYRLKPFTKKDVLLTFFSGLILILYFVCLLYLLWYGISKEDLEIPVILYILSVCGILLTAINTAGGTRMKKLAFIYFIPGAILFLISDSLFALNNFDVPIQNTDILIPLTYAVALFLIINAAVRVVRK